MRSMLATAVAATLLAVGCLAQTVPIPSRPDGYRYPPNANATALVQIDAYFDLMCPDCLVSALAAQISANWQVQLDDLLLAAVDDAGKPFGVLDRV